MKTYRLFSILIVACLLAFSTGPASAVTLIKLGKGGAVIQPNGTYKLCPQFAFKKCCKITLSWKDLWNWITGDGCWDDDINSNMPLQGDAVVYDDHGLPTGNYNVNIVWINPLSCATVSGDEIIVAHPDIQLEVLQ